MFHPLRSKAWNLRRQVPSSRAVQCSPDDPRPYCRYCDELLPSSAVLWKHSFLLLALPSPVTPVACLGESTSVRRMEEEEDSGRGSAIPHKRPGQARLEREAPRSPCTFGTLPACSHRATVSTPESDALAIRGWAKNGSVISNRPTSGFLRKRCERRNGEAELLKVEAPKVDLPNHPELFEGEGDHGKGWELPWDEPLQIWGFIALTLSGEHRAKLSYAHILARMGRRCQADAIQFRRLPR